jgi:hypothetical protein
VKDPGQVLIGLAMVRCLADDQSPMRGAEPCHVTQPLLLAPPTVQKEAEPRPELDAGTLRVCKSRWLWLGFLQV